MLSQSALKAVGDPHIGLVCFDGRFQNIDKRVLVGDQHTFFALGRLLARNPSLRDALYFLFLLGLGSLVRLGFFLRRALHVQIRVVPAAVRCSAKVDFER